MGEDYFLKGILDVGDSWEEGSALNWGEELQFMTKNLV